ncbi:Spy/CpxP family protein refolding chaperone [Noviherbaspirillum galbum]|uniref:Spy/CpxP family protein refolding chaperone n=1 Tax=Noviherbaspirillum galbum TaxID=2709383 RepID=A0A6B3SFM4_9BURK|nr:Spy/CpxP family protein refolding chaperone [Noviherbaspirillum galbum]NEX59697.1 Spy/CpxP family protein refolding chaperone [Noviherbaspirillum galbum]
MITIRNGLMIGLAALSFGAAPLAALAQDASGASGTGNAASARADHMEKMRQRMEQRAADLHAKLNLSPGQEAAWNTWISRMRPAAPAQRPAQADMSQLTAPERMERMLARMKEHEGMMSDRLAATKDFYATLTPEQKKTFDAEFKMGMRHGHHG